MAGSVTSYTMMYGKLGRINSRVLGTRPERPRKGEVSRLLAASKMVLATARAAVGLSSRIYCVICCRSSAAGAVHRTCHIFCMLWI